MKKIICWSLLLLIIACSKPVEVIQEKDDSGKVLVEYERRKKDFAKHGWYKRYYEDGPQVHEEAQYKDNKLEGERKLYYKNGKPEAIEVYQNGVFEGAYKMYYPTGQMRQEGMYINGAMSGDWKFYQETSELKEVVYFKNNEENGPFKEYHKNGKLSIEGVYEGGNYEVGELKKYDESGILFAKMNCEIKMIAGRKFSECKTTWELGD